MQAFGLPILQVVAESLSNVAVAAPSNSGLGGNTMQGPRLSAEDRDAGFSVSPDGLQCQSRHDKQWCGGRATVGIKGGKYYYEAYVAKDGISRLGWSTAAGTLALGEDKHGFGFGGTGKKSSNRQFDSYGTTYSHGDYVGTMLDQENGTISFSVNGVDHGIAFQIPDHMKGLLSDG